MKKQLKNRGYNQMELNIFLFKVEKPSLKEKYTTYFLKEEIDNNPKVFCETIKKFSKIVCKSYYYYDIRKINEDYDVGIIDLKTISIDGTDIEGIQFQCENPIPEQYRTYGFDDTILFIPNDKLVTYKIKWDCETYTVDFKILAHNIKLYSGGNDEELIEYVGHYIDDKDLIQGFVDKGILNKNFIEKWIDRETILFIY